MDQPDVSAKKNENITLGPALPPHLQKKASSESEQDSSEPALKKNDDESSSLDAIAPVLPAGSNVSLKEQKTREEAAGDGSSESKTKSDADGSSKDAMQPTASCIGPTLPPHLREKLLEEAEKSTSIADEDDDDAFGPLPPGVASNSAAQRALEERALQMRLDSLNPVENNVPNREEWMLELPEVHAGNLGLGPRQFRAKSGPDMSDR